MSSARPPTTRVILIRHGDRLDYADKTWCGKARSAGTWDRDPPLSSLGHKQAREAAEWIKDYTRGGEDVNYVLASPYLRVLQTASYTADALKKSICIENGLGETHFTFGKLPHKQERFRYFPQVELKYVSTFKFPQESLQIDKFTGETRESYPTGYLRRMWSFARYFDRHAVEGTVVCFSHAASVAFVAGLLRIPMGVAGTEKLKFAPCGAYVLERVGGAGSPWSLLRSGFDNREYVTENSATTFPWGFGPEHCVSWNKAFVGQFVGGDQIPSVLGISKLCRGGSSAMIVDGDSPTSSSAAVVYSSLGKRRKKTPSREKRNQMDDNGGSSAESTVAGGPATESKSKKRKSPCGKKSSAPSPSDDSALEDARNKARIRRAVRIAQAKNRLSSRSKGAATGTTRTSTRTTAKAKKTASTRTRKKKRKK